MRIDKIVIDKNKYGINKTTLRFKNSLTVLAGRNGSGKSRTLNLIIDKTLRNEGAILSEIPNYMNRYSPSSQDFLRYKRALILKFTPETIRVFQENLNTVSKVNNYDYDSVILNTPENFQGNELDLVTTTSINHFYKFPTLYLLKKSSYSSNQDKNWRATKIYRQYKSLKDKFKTFLNKDIECVYDEQQMNNVSFDAQGRANGIKANWLINNRPFKYEELSDGEKTLFSYILLFYLQEQFPYSKTKDSIILIDEPETHLHPEAQIKLIKGLLELTQEKGQIIIATHSIPILSICNSDSIFFLKDSEIFTPSSKLPKSVLEDLVGYQELNTHLKPLLTNVSEWAFNSFLIDCFNNPEIIDNENTNDPQYNQLKSFLIEREYLKILDFGAGKGRLERALEKEGLTKFDFDVYEPFKENIEILSEIKIVDNVFIKLTEISGKYDLIILSNVLHEIPVNEWVKNLNKIKSLLNENGYLLILEDLELRTGEKPNENGYLVLKSDELSTLLNYKDKPLTISPLSNNYKDRLECTVFKKESINQVNINSLKSSIIKLKERSYNKAIEHRKETFYKNGRTYAFYAQQYINAEFSLNLLNNKS